MVFQPITKPLPYLSLEYLFFFNQNRSLQLLRELLTIFIYSLGIVC